MNKPETNPEVEKAMNVIMKQLNIMGTSNVGTTIAEVLMEDHRTLQQNFFREIYTAMCLYSDSYSDLRNEASVDFAMKVKQMEQYFPFV